MNEGVSYVKTASARIKVYLQGECKLKEGGGELGELSTEGTLTRMQDWTVVQGLRVSTEEHCIQ